jgi:hypothetical protein
VLLHVTVAGAHSSLLGRVKVLVSGIYKQKQAVFLSNVLQIDLLLAVKPKKVPHR